MRRHEAKREALEGNWTWGQLHELVKARRGKGGTSKINKGLTVQVACDIFEKVIVKHDPEDKPDTSLVGNQLIVQNILRECK